MQIAQIPERPMGLVSRHTFSGFAGGLCLAIGYVASAVFLLVMVIAISDVVENTRTDLSGAWLTCAVTAVAGILFVSLGLRLVRGRRRLVLFLRRFGLAESTAAMTRAISDGLGSQWRIVTLDDHAVAPIGVDETPRRRLRRARYATVGLALLLGGGLLWLLVANWSNEPGPQALIGNVILLIVVAIPILVLIAFAVTMLAGLSTASWFARAADRSRIKAITRPEQIDTTAKRLASAARHVFSSRLVVVRVDNAFWPQVVDRLIQLCDAIVVDISSPSPNLEWEMARLNAGAKPWIPLGQLDRLAVLQQDASADAQNVRTLIGSRLVLAYRDDHPRALAQTLGAALNSTVT